MTKRARTDFIVIHCSANRPNADIGVQEIRLILAITLSLDEVGLLKLVGLFLRKGHMFTALIIVLWGFVS